MQVTVSLGEIDAYSLYQNALANNANQIDRLKLETYLREATDCQIEASLSFYGKTISSEQLRALENRIITFIERSSSLSSVKYLPIRIGLIFNRIYSRILCEKDQEVYEQNQKALADIRKDIDKVYETIDEVHKDIDKVHETIDKVHEDIQKTNEIIGRTNERTERVNEKIENFNEDIKTVKGMIYEALEIERYSRRVIRMALAVVFRQYQQTEGHLNALQDLVKKRTALRTTFRIIIFSRHLKVAALVLSILVTLNCLRKHIT